MQCVHFAREIRKDFAEAEEREQRLQGHMDAERAKAEKELAQKRRDEEEKAKEEASANGSAVPVVRYPTPWAFSRHEQGVSNYAWPGRRVRTNMPGV